MSAVEARILSFQDNVEGSSSFLRAGGVGAEVDVSGSSVELYHPEHEPFHVMRLGRFHHGPNMDAFIRAEQQWSKGESMEQLDDGKPFFRLPHYQVEALLQHQAHANEWTTGRRSLDELRGRDHDASSDDDAAVAVATAALVAAEAEAEAAAEAAVQAASAAAAAVAAERDAEVDAQRSDREGLSLYLRGLQRGHKGTKVLTPLEYMGSMYVGPMGVGTVLPDGCPVVDLQGSSLLAAEGGPNASPPPVGALQLSSNRANGTGSNGKRGSKWRLSVLSAGDDGSGAGGGVQDDTAAVEEEDDFMQDNFARENVGCYPQSESKLNVVYDTGSTNMWISSDLCTKGGCILPGRHRFNFTKSITFSFPKTPDEISVTFGTGMLQGPLGTDDLRVGPVASRQTFAMMERQSGDIWSEIPIEGIVGLAFPSLATKNAPPFFDSVISQKVMKHNEFAFYLSRNNEASNALMWGGVDKAFYTGKIEYFPVAEAHYWSLELHSFKIGHKTYFGTGQFSKSSIIPPKRHVAILDSGTTFLAFPSTIWPAVSGRLQGRPCNEMTRHSHPPMTFTLRNAAGELRDLELTNSEYMTQENGRCTPCIMVLDVPKEHGPGLVLGDTFLREFFSVYDRGDGTNTSARVGLARAAPTRTVTRRLGELTRTQPSMLQGRSSSSSPAPS